jgi:branched-chain amino acid transport system permease protein
MIEMVYHLQLNEVLGPQMKYLGLELNAKGVASWVGAGVVLLAGLALFELARRRFVPMWGRVQDEIEAEIRQRGMVA